MPNQQCQSTEGKYLEYKPAEYASNCNKVMGEGRLGSAQQASQVAIVPDNTHPSSFYSYAFILRIILRLMKPFLLPNTHTHTHTHTHTTVLLLVWNMSGSTRVSRYQKGKTKKVQTNLDLLEQEIVRKGSGICWDVCNAYSLRPPARSPPAGDTWVHLP